MLLEHWTKRLAIVFNSVNNYKTEAEGIAQWLRVLGVQAWSMRILAHFPAPYIKKLEALVTQEM